MQLLTSYATRQQGDRSRFYYWILRSWGAVVIAVSMAMAIAVMVRHSSNFPNHKEYVAAMVVFYTGLGVLIPNRWCLSDWGNRLKMAATVMWSVAVITTPILSTFVYLEPTYYPASPDLAVEVHAVICDSSEIVPFDPYVRALSLVGGILAALQPYALHLKRRMALTETSARQPTLVELLWE